MIFILEFSRGRFRHFTKMDFYKKLVNFHTDLEDQHS